MTFTEDSLKAGKGLHVELKQSEIERDDDITHWTISVSRIAGAKDELRSFWLRHGEDVLTALEKAWARITAYKESLAILTAEGNELRRRIAELERRLEEEET